MLTEHTVRSARGRNIAVWALESTSQPTPPRPIVLAPGFARRMDHLGPLAVYLAHNGFTVYRYDSLDHVGLSDGTMLDFSMSAGLESMDAVVDWVRARHAVPEVGVIAMSLMARVAYQLASRHPGIAFLLLAVGVVNVRRTLHAVWNHDIAGTPVEALPTYVEFEGHYIRSRGFWTDAQEKDWWSVEGTVRALQAVDRPLACFASPEDEWVDASELERVFSSARAGSRRLIHLERSSHDLGRNAAVARVFFQRTTATALELSGLAAGSIREPAFEQIVEQALVERRLERTTAIRHVPADSFDSLKMVRRTHHTSTT
ncbi:hypothetical protein [Pendulispora albinea]|uniref:Acyl transferase n=1 Tax=Pendulispora albinea TaxID=2741071 RepID=A0ABZ2LKR0_9BACT